MNEPDTAVVSTSPGGRLAAKADRRGNRGPIDPWAPAERKLRGALERLESLLIEAQQRRTRQASPERPKGLLGVVRGAARPLAHRVLDWLGGELAAQRSFRDTTLEALEVLAEALRSVNELQRRQRHLEEVVEASSQRAAASRPGQNGTLNALMDARFLAFEERFRGAWQDIRERSRRYIDSLRSAGAGVEGRPVVDLGCGRGEWLDLLQEHGLQAYGVDRSAAVARYCRDRGVEVVEADLLTFLEDQPDSSLGAVTAIQVLEHFPIETVDHIAQEVWRVLKPGGLFLFETPNPHNLIVGANTFYVDPTHVRPLHPATMAFLLEQRGYVRVETTFLRPPIPNPTPCGDEGVLKLLGEHLLAGMDYAVSASKPA